MSDTKKLPSAACVLVIKDGKILAVSRKHDPNDFGLPGGKVEAGETYQQAAAREALEETGYKLQNLEFVFGEECPGEVTYWAATFKADLADEQAKPVASDEGRVAWVEPSKLVTGSFGDYNKRLFKEVGIAFE